jgi:hypothetical protein
MYSLEPCILENWETHLLKAKTFTHTRQRPLIESRARVSPHFLQNKPLAEYSSHHHPENRISHDNEQPSTYSCIHVGRALIVRFSQHADDRQQNLVHALYRGPAAKHQSISLTTRQNGCRRNTGQHSQPNPRWLATICQTRASVSTPTYRSELCS